MPGNPASRPIIRVLSQRACEAILRRNSVGRVAYSQRARIDIEPLHYVLVDGFLYGRTSRGSKLTTVARSPWVAFEVDEIDGPFDWRSVVVHGAWYTRSPESPRIELTQWEHGLEALRQLVPGTFASNDPAPFRTTLFRIHVSEISGRLATSRRSK